MAAATPPEIEGNFIRFSSWRILPEEQYAKRMRILRELSSATEGTCTDQFWKVMGQVDDWEWEDMDPGLLPKDEHVHRAGRFAEPAAWRVHRLPEPTAWQWH